MWPLLLVLAVGALVFMRSDVESATVRYGPNARPMPPYARAIVARLFARAGIASGVVTSTRRAPSDQARAMFDNVERFGATSQLALYGDAGDEVVRLIAAQMGRLPPDAVKQNAAALISALHAAGRVVSVHIVNPHRYAIDVAPSSIDGRAGALVAAAEQDPEVLRVIGPPKDPAVHIEIRAEGGA